MKRSVGAVDIGGTKIAVGLVRDDGSVLAQRKLPTQILAGPANGVPAIAHALRECQSECHEDFAAVGIGCTGPVDPILGTIGSVSLLPGWEGCTLVDDLRRRFAVPAALENDADAAALAEYQWGGHGRSERFLFVTVSTGIGAGLLVSGSIYRGAQGTHPEIGHHAIDPNGPPCYCGANGCWESLCSGTAIALRYRQERGDELSGAQDVDSRMVFERAAAFDPHARSTIAAFVNHMGIALANLITLFAPDRIVLGGGVSQSLSHLLPQIGLQARRRSREVPVDVSITAASLGERSGLAGAAAVGLLAQR